MEALDDILVADFTRVLAGPYATMLLADLGADVIKVERAGIGDDTRAWGPPFDTDGNATYFLSVNRNKRSLALDLTDAADRTLAVELARRADVVVHNFKAGAMAGWGLSYDDVRAINPGAIYCEISGFGPDSDLPGYDLLAQAVGGLMSITGDPASPTKVGVALVDVITGLHAATGILAALHARGRSGVGQLVQVNLLSSLLSAMVNQTTAYAVAGIVPQATGNAHPSIAPYQPLPTADRPIVVTVGNDAQFRRMCQALGAPELAADARYNSNAARVAHRAELVAELTTLLASAGADHWAHALTDAGVPAGPINDISEAFDLADRLGLAPLRSFEDGPGTTTASPIGLSATPARHRSPNPQLGAADAQLRAWLTSEPRLKP